jgi:2-methylcitrate dehydratase PrpD
MGSEILPISEVLADFIVNANFGNIPRDAIEVSKIAIMDTIGVNLCASCTEPVSSLLEKFVEGVGGRPDASIIGKSLRCAPPYAAMVNGTLAHYLDYDDISFQMRGHPSVAILPAILALGEKHGCSGKEILESYVAGLEVMAKIGSAIALDHSEKGWHTTGTLGTIGATAASAKILKLDREKTQMALGIGASKATGLRQNFGTFCKPLHAGSAAKNGVEAAMLAELGFTSSRNIWEGKYGFLDTFTNGSDYDLQEILKRLGDPYSVISPGIVLKKYSSCSSTHVAIEAMLKLISTSNIIPERVKSINCDVNYRVLQDLIHHDPKTGVEGRFSMEFCLAAALIERRVDLDQFEDKKINDPQIRNIMKKVRMNVPPELQSRDKVDAGYTIVTVELMDGQKYSIRLENTSIKGFPSNPLTREELLGKYKKCADRSALKDEQVKRSIEVIGHLERVTNIGELMENLSPGG